MFLIPSYSFKISKLKISLLLAFCFTLLPYLLKAQEPKLMLPIGHTMPVTSLDISADSKLLLSASEDKTVKLWDSRNGYVILDLLAHADIINTTKFSHDGKLFTTASRDKTAKVFDILTGKTIATILHTGNVLSAKFSKDDSKILTYDSHGNVKISDTKTGNLINNFKANYGSFFFAVFSPSEEFVITNNNEKAIIWDTKTGKTNHTLIGHQKYLKCASFSPDGKKVATGSDDFIVKIWDVSTGNLLHTLSQHTNEIKGINFSPDGKKIITASYDKTAKIWDAETGKLLADLTGHPHWVENATFSNDGNNILTISAGSQAEDLRIFDSKTGTLRTTIKGSQNTSFAMFSPTGNSIVAVTRAGEIRIWNTQTNEIYASFAGFVYSNTNVVFSANGKQIITSPVDATMRVWDVATGKLTETLRDHKSYLTSIFYSPSGDKIISASSWDSTVIIRNATDFKPITTIKTAKRNLLYANFSPDEKKIIIVDRNFENGNYTNQIAVYSAKNNKQLFTLVEEDLVLHSIFSKDGKKLLISKINGNPKIYDANDGKLLFELENKTKHQQVSDIKFSKDDKYIIQSSNEVSTRIWNANNGTLVFGDIDKRISNSVDLSVDNKNILSVSNDLISVFDWHNNKILLEIKKSEVDFRGALFTPDENKVLLWKDNGILELWDINSARLIYTFKGHKGAVTAVKFSPDKNLFVSTSLDNTCILWDLNKGTFLYTFFAVYYQDYMVLDKYNRYDGSQDARNLLYFTCGSEVIALDQIKDQLWVPNLAERVMKGQAINSPKLSEIDICGLTPQVESIDNEIKDYRFKIMPRRGNLGQTILYVNGIEVKRYEQNKLIKIGNYFELNIPATELKPYFVAGQENPVTVKAYTFKNDISSRGAKVTNQKADASLTPPNLYAVIVGVSEYKGTELDLKYAAKDANDIASALGNSARKLLNTDGKEHVFIYNLNTTKDAQFPEKLSIKNAFADVGKKANANDIFIVFFAGHGVMEGTKKQFYFLTANASKSSTASQVGISTDELSEWMKPANIKAQKRILIFDACNSGQAVNELVKIGQANQQYLAARNDDKSQQIKAIEKLNEKSGLFILSASASNQSAYEMGRFSQGLLTYALLKAMKEQPDILDDNKYLNVGKWFTAAEKTVTDIVRESGNRQEPQVVSMSNFNIGIVDQEVMAKIILPQEKTLFASSNFQNNDEAIADDDLELSKAINQELNKVSARGTEAIISYVIGTNSPDAYALSGRYAVNGNEIMVRVNIRQHKEIKYKFELKGKKDGLATVVEDIVKKAAEWASKNK